MACCNAVMQKQCPAEFFKIVRASDGRQVLAFLELENKALDYWNVQVLVSIDGQPSTHKFQYSGSSARTMAFDSFRNLDQKMADKFVRHFVLLYQGKFDDEWASHKMASSN